MIKKFENFNRNELPIVNSCVNYTDEDSGKSMIKLFMTSGNKAFELDKNKDKIESIYKKIKFLEDKGYIDHRLYNYGIDFHNYESFDYRNDNRSIYIVALEDDWFLVSLYDGGYNRYLVDQRDELVNFLKSISSVRPIKKKSTNSNFY